MITLPIQIAVQVVGSIIQVVFALFWERNSPASGVLFAVIILGLTLLSGAVILPFWQAIKAVIYYDLRMRREGMGLKLRDRDI